MIARQFAYCPILARHVAPRVYEMLNSHWIGRTMQGRMKQYPRPNTIKKRDKRKYFAEHRKTSKRQITSSKQISAEFCRWNVGFGRNISRKKAPHGILYILHGLDGSSLLILASERLLGDMSRGPSTNVPKSPYPSNIG